MIYLKVTKYYFKLVKNKLQVYSSFSIKIVLMILKLKLMFFIKFTELASLAKIHVNVETIHGKV